MGRYGGGFKGGHYGSSRAWGQHKAAASSYRASHSYPPSNKTASTWGARGAAAAYGKTGTKAAAASGAYRTTLAHGGTKGQAKAAARGAAAGLSKSGGRSQAASHTPGSSPYWAYPRAVSDYSRAVESFQRQLDDYVKPIPQKQAASDYGTPQVSPEDAQSVQQSEKIHSKLQECLAKLEELRVLMRTLHGCQLYRARCTETKLLNLIDQLESALNRIGCTTHLCVDAEAPSAGITYHSIEQEAVNHANSQTPCKNDEGPTIEYHQLGA